MIDNYKGWILIGRDRNKIVGLERVFRGRIEIGKMVYIIFRGKVLRWWGYYCIMWILEERSVRV